MAFKVVLSPRAQRDLEDIRDYIAGNDPDTAYSFCSNLAKHAYSLRTFPNAVMKSATGWKFGKFHFIAI